MSAIGRYQQFMQQHPEAGADLHALGRKRSRPDEADLMMMRQQQQQQQQQRGPPPPVMHHLMPPGPEQWTADPAMFESYYLDQQAAMTGGAPAGPFGSGGNQEIPTQPIFAGEPRMTPKTKVPVGAGGSSCHQCKNRREPSQLNFCKNRTRTANSPKKKVRVRTWGGERCPAAGC